MSHVVRLHYVEAGQGEPVVLLHGFPEFWYSWRHQLPALAEAGFRAIAPDLRGYNQSGCPAGVANYRVAKLVEDVAGLVREVAGGPAFVVGHDWGGVLAWRLAAQYPALVRGLAVLNAPHPAAFREELRRNPVQWLRSWYVLFFQLPGLPEWSLRAGDFALLERAWRRQPVHPGAFRPEDIAAYKRALRRPGALTGPLNYYRAAFRYPRDLYSPPQAVQAPTLLVWGERDPFLGVRLTEGLGQWVPDLRVERIADASHWVQNDVPDRVNGLLIRFFAD
jgi:epoxide hydrolase 4